MTLGYTMFIFLLNTYAHFERIRNRFAMQELMKTSGVHLSKTELDFILIELPYAQNLIQKHGCTFSGILNTLADNVGRFATPILLNDGHNALTDEFKPNSMAPDGGKNQ
jgi:acyl-coenzyme A thioesterase PaaI-like protein